jgi:hypothetical protein
MARRYKHYYDSVPVREDLQPVWCRVLLHSGHRYLPEARWLGPHRIQLRFARLVLADRDRWRRALYARTERQYLAYPLRPHGRHAHSAEYGTLRTYIASGITTSNGSNASSDTYNNRAFIQWAGFTVGLASSFYDFAQFADFSNQTNIIGSDTGGNGLMLWAYTAQLGNGLSASISLEDSAHSYRKNGIVTDGTAAAAFNPATGLIVPWLTSSTEFTSTGGIAGNHYAGIGTRWPDIVGNIRWEGAWGAAQIMGAIHDVGADYYSDYP